MSEREPTSSYSIQKRMEEIQRKFPGAKINVASGYEAKSLDTWYDRFFKRFLDGIGSSEVISPETFDESYLVEIFSAISDNISHVFASDIGFTVRTDDLIIPIVNSPEMCADIALLAYEIRKA